MGALNLLLKALLGGGAGDPSSNLSPEEAHRRLKEKNPPQLIDVRTREEYREARLQGSRLIPLHELGGRLREIDKAKPVLLYCRSGNRSGMAFQLLRSNGYLNVAHVRGGILAWGRSGLPVETQGI